MKRVVLLLSLVLGVMSRSGCVRRVVMAAPRVATFEGAVRVQPIEAVVWNGGIGFKALYTNLTADSLHVTRGDFTVRLPDGKVLRANGYQSPESDNRLPPGESRQIDATFPGALNLPDITGAVVEVSANKGCYRCGTPIKGQIPLTGAGPH